jgi:hypothetical protein
MGPKKTAAFKAPGDGKSEAAFAGAALPCPLHSVDRRYHVPAQVANNLVESAGLLPFCIGMPEPRNLSAAWLKGSGFAPHTLLHPEGLHEGAKSARWVCHPGRT